MLTITPQACAAEFVQRDAAYKTLAGYIAYTNKNYKPSWFSQTVCAALDKFVADVIAGLRPILVFQAPPQHGKSEMVSRKLPAMLMGAYPDWRIGAASYSDGLANSMALDVARNIATPEHQRLWASPKKRRKYDVERMGEFTNPRGRGSYLGVGIGGPLTGIPIDIGIIDDPTKNQQEALSPVTKESHWSWYQTVFTTRLSQFSGQIIMATAWGEDDLPSRIINQFRGDVRLTVLRFPAINEPDEVGYQPEMPRGALVPALHSLDKLYETKALFSDYWWAALYQQSPKALGGNVFKDSGVQYYFPKDLPKRFDLVIASWDCTFKDTDGTDFVVGQVWGKAGPNAWLLDQVRARMSFTATTAAVIAQKNKWPAIQEILIEDKANGPAVIDTLRKVISGLVPIEPDGSKLARSHAVTSYWEALNVFIPSFETHPWIVEYVRELTGFPAAANDDQVDSTTQALRRLFPLVGTLAISREALDAAMGIRRG